MASKIRKLGVLVSLGAVLLLGVALLALSYTEVGSSIGVEVEEGFSLSAHDLTALPKSVVEDATRLATELFGDYKEKYEDFVSQLLAAYAEASDRDFVVVFNSGGWGWKLIDSSPGWSSIFAGIKSELDSLGYSSLMLNYQRTGESLRGRARELFEAISYYPSKAENLACRVEFLTDHIPDLRVIITGESNGAIIADSAMNVLQYNPQVYSIQTGPPFWYENAMLDRTLVLDDNGVVPDAFTEGDVPLMLWESLKTLLGLSPPEQAEGNVLGFLRAPGHDYQWRYPNVYSQVTAFLEDNFGSGE